MTSASRFANSGIAVSSTVRPPSGWMGERPCFDEVAEVAGVLVGDADRGDLQAQLAAPRWRSGHRRPRRVAVGATNLAPPLARIFHLLGVAVAEAVSHDNGRRRDGRQSYAES